MARSFVINGPTLVTVNGSELGLSDQDIRVNVELIHDDIRVDATGDSPPNLQFMGATASVDMTLVHFDPSVLNSALQTSMVASAVGQLGQAGSLMTTGFSSLRLTSPVGNMPWTFPNAYIQTPYGPYPLGTRRTIVHLSWRIIPYQSDPYNGGQGSQGTALWTNS